LNIATKGEHYGIIEFRKFYSGYLKGLPDTSKVRSKLVVSESYNEIEDLLNQYKQELEQKMSEQCKKVEIS
jgi:hypothetical protein